MKATSFFSGKKELGRTTLAMTIHIATLAMTAETFKSVKSRSHDIKFPQSQIGKSWLLQKKKKIVPEARISDLSRSGISELKEREEMASFFKAM